MGQVPSVRAEKIKLAVNSDGRGVSYYWLVTDNIGVNDSSYRVVYDEEQNMFGLECMLANGIEWYMGAYGTFREAIENM